MRFNRKNIPPFIIVSLLFGLKTYIVYRIGFDMNIDNLLQEIILFINSFVTSFVIFLFSILFKEQNKRINYLKYVSLIGTLLIYFNLVFYRSFTDFLTFPQLFQVSNMGDLGTSILSLIHIFDIFIFVDVIIVWFLCNRSFLTQKFHFPKRRKVFIFTVALFLLSFNFLLAEIERPQLLKRGFDREYLVKNIGLFNYHIYDLVLQSKLKTKKVLADGNELNEIISYIEEDVRSKEKSELYNVAEDRNIIFISAESIQSFVIDREIDGEEITPFLNELTKDEDTYYFENFYHQTEQGKTSDSEFITENSLYPSSRGAIFFTHSDNTFHSLSEILKEKNYHSAVFHPNDGTFWNRNQMYDTLKIDEFYDKEFYDVNEENSIGWGLKDKPFFEQSIQYLKNLPEPYYAKFITLTNHFPFDLEEEDRTIEPYDSNSQIFNNYIPTVRYMDEAIELFFDELKKSGLYEDSIIMIMGDHDGISAEHDKAIMQFLDLDELTAYDLMQWQRVPLFIHIPGHGEGKIMSKISGQIDLKPTMLHMAGIDTEHDIYFGNDLFHNDRKEFIAFRNGDFVSEKYVYTNDTCYDRLSGNVLDEENMTIANESLCKELSEQVEKELFLSDEIIHGDLFRYVQFYK
ncbi:MAG TPA: LTA synthase family protein [Bacillota bacterium]|nr:LTA synthase family protein [Bacillota bacterium]